MGVPKSAEDSNKITFRRYASLLFTNNGNKNIIKYIKVKLKKILYSKSANLSAYGQWLAKHYPDSKKLDTYRNHLNTLSFQPIISLLLPLNNDVEETSLKFTIDSLLDQVYANWELCITHDHISKSEFKKILDEYAALDHRIKIIHRTAPGNSAACTTTALEYATGDYVALLEQDCRLSPDALFQNVKLMNKHKDAEIIYSDEDKFDEQGNFLQPFFKQNWCPDSFLSANYLGNFLVISRKLALEAGGFRIEYDGCHVYDLLLRATELSRNIFHIPLVLYHSKNEILKTENNNIYDAGVKALEDALVRRNIKGIVKQVTQLPGAYSIRYEIVSPGLVSIIIPSRNKHQLCETIVSSIFSKTEYTDLEIILVDNNSDESTFFEFIKKWREKEPERFKYIKDTGNFNFPRLVNCGAAIAKGKYLLLLNNDTEVIHADWLTAMVEQAQFSTTGAAGIKLLYPNDTVQHAGVVIGLGGIAGHTFVGYDKDAPGYAGLLQRTTNYSAVTAACMMVRKEVFDEVGGFEEELAVEFNDIDFCLKLKEKNYQNIYLPHVSMYHYESVSRGNPLETNFSRTQHIADVSFFKNRWQKYINNDPCYSPNLSLTVTDMFLE